MKKLILLFIIAGFLTQAQAQKMMAKDVPGAVTAVFYKAHPTIKDVDWKRDGSNYEAEYDKGKLDKSVTYDASGKLLETEVEILASELPSSVMEYVKKTYKENEVKEASKITDANGTVTYEAEVKGKDLIFDSKGNFIKAIKDQFRFFVQNKCA